MTAEPQSTVDTAGRLRQMIAGYQVTQAVHAAAVLGVADLLADGAEYSERLAHALGVPEDPLYRLLRELAGVGVVEEVAPRRFGLTPVGELLRSDRADSQRPMAVMAGQDWMWRPWGRLVDSVRTGRTAFDSVFGMPFFGYLQADAQARAVFQGAMRSANTRAAVADHYDFSGSRTVADVGGGHGPVLASILQKHPHVEGVLFERPAVLDAAREHLASAGVLDRCRLVAGDFFESVCEGADTYVLSQILHDWDDTDAVAILANCRRVMAPGSRLLVVERVAKPHGVPHTGPLADLMMLVMLGGRERTGDEYEALLAKAGIRLARTVPVGEAWRVLEGVPGEE
jgi:SAM-dependent methyltransferase